LTEVGFGSTPPTLEFNEVTKFKFIEVPAKKQIEVFVLRTGGGWSPEPQVNHTMPRYYGAYTFLHEKYHRVDIYVD
jgi:hypothetical protein